ncbi:MAG: FAD-dependent oxidoreductase, partial [Thermodesulfobacteriota bacterium]|nr:FAD-dependent oxidoreductase [Thermodesulfobacteriota bacterium]
IVKKLFDHSRAYIFQNSDGRIIFAIPYEHDFTLIGTTDVDFSGDPGKVQIDREEIEYLCKAADEYFQKQITAADVVHAYSGIRPLFDDGASAAKAATRDYILKLDNGDGDKAPLLSIYGGKITTYRKLAESVLAKLRAYLPDSAGTTWTESASLPGGDFAPAEFAREVERLQADFPFLDNTIAYRMIRTYGRQAFIMLEGTNTPEELGICFGSALFEKEVHYLMTREWARTAEDVLWRRTNMGLFFSSQEVETLDTWMRNQVAGK